MDAGDIAILIMMFVVLTGVFMFIGIQDAKAQDVAEQICKAHNMHVYKIEGRVVTCITEDNTLRYFPTDEEGPQ